MVLKFVDANGGSHSFSVQSLAPPVETVQRVDTKTAPDGTVYKRALNPRHSGGILFDSSDSWSTCPAGTYKLGSTDSLKTIELEFDYESGQLRCGFTNPKIGSYNLNWGAIYNLPEENGKCCFVAFDYGGTTYIGVAINSTTNPDKFMVGQAISANYFDEAVAKPYMPDYDYGGGSGDSGDTGGYGDGIPDGDSIGTHDTLDEPSKQALLGYGLHAYVMTGAALLSLTKYLWGVSESYRDAMWKRWENYKFNPIAGVISCHRLPSQLAPSGAAAVPISIAGLTLSGGGEPALDAVTGSPFIYNRVWSSVYSVSIPAPTEDFTDFSGVAVSVYLPFCGTMALDPSQCIGGKVYVQYCCNVLNGECAAIVLTEDQFGYVTCAGSATGNCAEMHPLSGNDNGMGGIVSGASTIMSSAVQSLATQNPMPLVGGVVSGITQMITAPHHTQVIGNPSGSAGWCSQWTCYVSVYYNVPIESENAVYNSEFGRPSMDSGIVGDFAGYGEFTVHADNVTGATDFEKREIERLCAQGVIV